MTVLAEDNPTSSGKLIPLLTAFFYIFFTLILNSHSLMVQWPWIFFWQIGLICPILWLIWLVAQRKFQRLGYRWDYIIGFIGLGLMMSAIFAQFPNQARWYSWGALGYIAALYVLNYRLSVSKNKHHLLIFQGYLSFAFIIISLIGWIFLTLLPELNRLNTLKQAGINVVFDFSTVTLRNWVPLGHQNYVAGYLVLSIPLFVGLAIIKTGWQRKLWISAIILGLIDLYTTSSRGGWLGLGVLCLWGMGVLLFRSRIRKLWVILGGLGAVFGLIILALLNNRLRSLIFALLQGQGGGELAYRYINAVIGWNMGKNQPFTGVGLGNVPQLYQKYRPFWAGRESEFIYQLHSTPVQLWAEIGLFGVLSLLGVTLGLIFLIWQFTRLKMADLSPSAIVLFWCLMGGLWAYGAVSLTDYQLDNMAISGIIIIYLASLIAFLPSAAASSPSPLFAYGGIGLLLVVFIWLTPIHRAWQLSSQGFLALRQEKIEPFTELLAKSHQLVPWEAYYPYQLGWNLGDVGIKTTDATTRGDLISDAISWLEKGNQVSPYHEFGHSNVGWLWMQKDAAQATKPFKKAIELVPAKRGLMYGLGLSFLVQNQVENALDALSLETLRDPAFITSPIWRSPSLQPIYNLLIERTLQKYNQLIEQENTSEAFKAYLKQCRGALYWWQGNFEKADLDWQNSSPPLGNLLLQIAQNKPLQGDIPLILQAWLTPSQRSEFIQQAYEKATKTTMNPELQQQFVESMNQSTRFHQWLTENAPLTQYRRTRLGFGVNMRHIDGVLPEDFLRVVENAAIKAWFEGVFPSPVYYPELDRALQPWRETLIVSSK